jgi:hypothetical protein
MTFFFWLLWPKDIYFYKFNSISLVTLFSIKKKFFSNKILNKKSLIFFTIYFWEEKNFMGTQKILKKKKNFYRMRDFYQYLRKKK